MGDGIATLGARDGVTSFAYGSTTVRFRTSPRLRRWLRVEGWDRGRIVADGECEGQDGPVEDYIGLVPVLGRLYVDPGEFLAPIREVRVA